MCALGHTILFRWFNLHVCPCRTPKWSYQHNYIFVCVYAKYENGEIALDGAGGTEERYREARRHRHVPQRVWEMLISAASVFWFDCSGFAQIGKRKRKTLVHTLHECNFGAARVQKQCETEKRTKKNGKLAEKEASVKWFRRNCTHGTFVSVYVFVAFFFSSMLCMHNWCSGVAALMRWEEDSLGNRETSRASLLPICPWGTGIYGCTESHSQEYCTHEELVRWTRPWNRQMPKIKPLAFALSWHWLLHHEIRQPRRAFPQPQKLQTLNTHCKSFVALHTNTINKHVRAHASSLTHTHTHKYSGQVWWDRILLSCVSPPNNRRSNPFL